MYMYMYECFTLVTSGQRESPEDYMYMHMYMYMCRLHVTCFNTSGSLGYIICDRVWEKGAFLAKI